MHKTLTLRYIETNWREKTTHITAQTELNNAEQVQKRSDQTKRKMQNSEKMQSNRGYTRYLRPICTNTGVFTIGPFGPCPPLSRENFYF